MLSYVNWKFSFLLLIFIPLILMGLYDMYQCKKTIRRNFPLLGRMRYLLESIGPEIRQYFVETDLDGKPFNRLQRSIVYQRSKKENDTMPFGTQLDVYNEGYEWINHSIRAISFSNVNDNPRVRIGSSQCEKPYEASLFNISAMSFERGPDPQIGCGGCIPVNGSGSARRIVGRTRAERRSRSAALCNGRR